MQPGSEATGFLHGQWPHRQPEALWLGGQKRHQFCLPVFLPTRHYQKKLRRIRRLQEVAKQSGAIGIAPLHIVDINHQWAEIAQASQQFAQCAEGALAQLLRVEHRIAICGGGDCPHLVQNRKDPRQSHHATRQYPVHFTGGHSCQVARQRIHHTVERLEGERLLFIAPAHENERIAAVTKPVEKMPNEGTLAHTRLTDNQHHLRGAVPGSFEGGTKNCEVALTTDESLLLPPIPPHRGPACGCGGGACQPGNHLSPDRTPGRIALQQFHAKPGKVRIQFSGCRFQRGSLQVLFLLKNFCRRACKRALPAKSLVQHHTQGIPVGSLAQWIARCLFRRHIGHGAGYAVRIRRPALIQALRQTKIKDHDSPFRRNHYVGRFQIPVKNARRVQRRDALRQLSAGFTHANRRTVDSTVTRGPGIHCRHRVPGRERGGIVSRLTPRNSTLSPLFLSQEFQKTHALNEFHGDEPLIVHRQEFIERSDVGMTETRERPELVFEGENTARVHCGQCLEGNPGTICAVHRLVDNPHAPAAHAAQNPKPIRRAKVEGHWCAAFSYTRAAAATPAPSSTGCPLARRINSRPATRPNVSVKSKYPRCATRKICPFISA